MPAQRELRKNYIGLVTDKAEERHTEEQHAIESQAKPGHRMKDYFRTLVAALRNRHGDAG